MRFQKLLILLTGTLFSAITFAQKGIISGKITDASNSNVLTGATVILKNTNNKSITDIDGIFSLRNLDSGKYDLEISYVGYAFKTVTGVEVKAGQVATVSINLETQKANTLQSVSVVTEARRESLNTILNTRRNAAVVSDAISADMIRRSPDKNISDVLKRISGTTVQDNKFVVIRGMNDRYNEAMLNGGLLPSTEPDRKAFSFDIFPSDIVDNITIIKSALPEYPASFAGGLIQVNLKEIPDKKFISVRAGLGGNSITINKDFYHDKKGKYDWLGVDDGTRNIPYKFPNSKRYRHFSPMQQDAFASYFPNDWKPVKQESAPLNTQFQVAGSFNFINNKNGYPKLATVFGLSNYSSFRFNKIRLTNYGYANIINKDSVDTGPAFYNFRDSNYTHTILESALANFNFKLNANNKFFYNNLLAVNSTSLTDLRKGTAVYTVGGDFSNSYYGFAHYYQSNLIYNTQVGGEHLIPKWKLKIRWLGYYTLFRRNEPDYRQMVYYKNNPGDAYTAYISSPSLFTTVTGGLRLYFKTNDEAKGSTVDFTRSFTLFKQNQSLKFGFFYYFDKRNRDGRFLRNDIPNYNQSLLELPSDKIFAVKNFSPSKGFVVTDFALPWWIKYSGDIKQTAGYIMLNNKFTEKLRLAWGMRYENYKNTVSSYLQNTNFPTLFDTTFTDFLPSANFIYSVLPKSNIRLSYSRTLARPLYRELARTLFYDFFQNATFIGGPLSETKIDNYEIRWEQYFPGTEYYSVSGFYKKFKDPIEPKIALNNADSKTLTWANAPEAKNYGIEIEGRKNLDFITRELTDLYVYTNISLIKSKVFVKGNGSDTSNRPLQGQSPYIINAALQYAGHKNGITVNLQYNLFGPRISLIGDGTDYYIWEKVHPTLDFKISKTFLDKGLIEFSLSDIINKYDFLYWDVNDNKKFDKKFPDVIIQSKKFGTNAQLSVSWRFF